MVLLRHCCDLRTAFTFFCIIVLVGGRDEAIICTRQFEEKWSVRHSSTNFSRYPPSGQLSSSTVYAFDDYCDALIEPTLNSRDGDIICVDGLEAFNIVNGKKMWTYKPTRQSGDLSTARCCSKGTAVNGVLPVALIDPDSLSVSFVQLDTKTGQALGDEYPYFRNIRAACPRYRSMATCFLVFLHNDEDILIVALVVKADENVSSPQSRLRATMYTFSMARRNDETQSRFGYLWGGLVMSRIPDFVTRLPSGDRIIFVVDSVATVVNATNGAHLNSVQLVPEEERLEDFVVTPQGSYMVGLYFSQLSVFPVVSVASSFGGPTVYHELPIGTDDGLPRLFENLEDQRQRGWIRFAADGHLRIVTAMTAFRLLINNDGALVAMYSKPFPQYKTRDPRDEVIHGAVIASDGCIIAWAQQALWHISPAGETLRYRENGAKESFGGLPDYRTARVDSSLEIFVYSTADSVVAEDTGCISPGNDPTMLFRGFTWWECLLVALCLVALSSVFVVMMDRKEKRSNATLDLDSVALNNEDEGLVLTPTPVHDRSSQSMLVTSPMDTQFTPRDGQSVSKSCTF
eukprot:TRINITY_DN54965_c0_g1_i1.p1 TRINITY_DN54965_c0_g1~~TRINITY_DN54965_c0_g1_i1.p1  ORF type:complete len:573 (+),score=59.03 TRINITY_DN54965_c0_g1_i1:89-1807(+)